MAKPTKNAALICTILTIIALIGIIIGILFSKPIAAAACLLPAVIYEIYRTEGNSTKWASWVLLLVLILEIIFIIFNLSFDLAKFIGETERVVAGYNIPLGDIKVVGPALMAVLSIILFIRTRGKYTKWLAVIIFITCFAIVYSLDPEIFRTMLKTGIDEGLTKLN